jgi:diphosphomevalonate decarboxylase
VQLAPPEHLDLRDVALVLASGEKKVKSLEGHALARTSPLLDARLSSVREILPRMRRAILERDVPTIGALAELDCLTMHAVMMTSQPSLLYWSPETIAALAAVRRWREEGLPCWFTIDAGPNVHVLVEGDLSREVRARAEKELALPRERVHAARPGPGARLVADHLF